MDGSSAGSDSESEQLELEDNHSRSSGIGRELDDLRARAYGPNADIEGDPAALARLIELEAARVADAARVHPAASIDAAVEPRRTTTSPLGSATAAQPMAGSAPSSEPASTTSDDISPQPHLLRAMAARGGLAFIVESVVVVVILAYATTWLLVPHPVATLHERETQESAQLLQVLEGQGVGVDAATLRRFEPYRGIEVWAVEHSFLRGPCLIILDSVYSGRFDYHCVPRGVELILHQVVRDGFADWLPDESVVSFHLRQDTVEVFLHAPPG